MWGGLRNLVEFVFVLCENRICSWVGYAPHRTDSTIRLIRGIDPVNSPFTQSAVFGLGRLQGGRCAVEKTADAVTEPFPVDWFGEMLGESGGLGCADIAIGSEAAKGDATYGTPLPQLVHQL